MGRIALKAIESQVQLMDAIGMLNFPGVKEEVEVYFPGLLARPLEVAEDYWLK